MNRGLFLCARARSSNGGWKASASCQLALGDVGGPKAMGTIWEAMRHASRYPSKATSQSLTPTPGADVSVGGRQL